MTLVWAVLIAAALITVGSSIHTAGRNLLDRRQKARRREAWDRHVTTAPGLEPIYEQLTAERPEVAAVMSADWAAWAAEMGVER